MQKKKAYGTPTTHYRFNEDLLVNLLFPNGEKNEQSLIGKIPESITDLITNIQILINMSRNFSSSLEEVKLSQFLSKHPDAFIYTPAGKKWGTEADLKAASYIFNKIVEANSTAQVPNWFDWANDIRLLRTQVLCDKFSNPHHEICRRFKIANQDDFWNKNILSPTKLRKHWDRFHSVDPKSQSQINWDSTGYLSRGNHHT